MLASANHASPSSRALGVAPVAWLSTTTRFLRAKPGALSMSGIATKPVATSDGLPLGLREA